uniref:Uncharacterized protein n=1 Tax=Melopsittacus undulatus TaxID=13146 RepID=A0A8C6JC76_MELUD
GASGALRHCLELVTGSFAVVFPTKIATEQQSLMLVKRLLAVAVSCITYLRGIFPESAYRTRYMDGNRMVSCCFAQSVVKGLL